MLGHREEMGSPSLTFLILNIHSGVYSGASTLGQTQRDSDLRGWRSTLRPDGRPGSNISPFPSIQHLLTLSPTEALSCYGSRESKVPGRA